jgi:hypothetical protein
MIANAVRFVLQSGEMIANAVRFVPQSGEMIASAVRFGLQSGEMIANAVERVHDSLGLEGGRICWWIFCHCDEPLQSWIVVVVIVVRK